MKCQLICFSYRESSVNQFITKRKHTQQSFPLWYPQPDLSQRTLQTFHSELTDRSWETKQLHTSATCRWRFPVFTHNRTHSHTHSPYHQFAHWQQVENKQQAVATAATATAAAAQKAYAMLAHWWRLQTNTMGPTGNNCQTGCHSHTRVHTHSDTHTHTHISHSNTHSIHTLTERQKLCYQRSQQRHTARTNWN